MRILLAKALCRLAHWRQVRKYTGEPYYTHPVHVASLVQEVPHDRNMLIAALLHDTVEDTWVKPWLIRLLFGKDVAQLVSDLTAVSKMSDGNRAVRKNIDLLHTAMASPRAKTIKLADLLSNTNSILEHDAKFARIYIKEATDLLLVLKDGNPMLHRRLSHLLGVKDNSHYGYLSSFLATHVTT